MAHGKIKKLKGRVLWTDWWRVAE